MTVGNTEIVGLGGHLVVSVLASYSDDPSLNPAEAYSFFCKYCLKRTKINKKEAVVGPFLKKAKKSYFSNLKKASAAAGSSIR